MGRARVAPEKAAYAAPQSDEDWLRTFSARSTSGVGPIWTSSFASSGGSSWISGRYDAPCSVSPATAVDARQVWTGSR